jgi:hypothetical protein
MDNPNPYDPPENAPVRAKTSGFAKGWVITDLVFCGLRLMAALLGLVGASQIPDSNPIAPTIAYEVIAGMGIACLGIPANILLLNGRRLGVTLAWVSLLFTALSIGVSLWQIGIQMDQVSDQAARAGMAGGVIVVIIIRLGLNITYAVVVHKAARLFAAGASPERTQLQA